jgi:hypothetical protein
VQTFIGTNLLSSQLAQPTNKPFEIYDDRLAGFTLRVQPTGVRSYYARLKRNRRFALGKVGALQPDEARDRCKQVLSNVAHGRHPLHGLNGEGLTLGQFIEESYVPWVKTNRPRTAANTLEKLKRHFETWYAEPLSTITAERIELWKIRRVNTGRVPTTVMRDIFTLSSVLRRAVRLGKLTDNPVRRVDKPRIDRRPKIRFLDQQAAQTRPHHEIPLARPPSSLCFALGLARCPAQYRTGSSGSQLSSNVLAICPLGTRPTARGGRQARSEAASCACPALTARSQLGRVFLSD